MIPSNEDRQTDRELYERDLQALHKACLDALLASQSRPLTEDEAMALAWSAGFSVDFYKETRK